MTARRPWKFLLFAAPAALAVALLVTAPGDGRADDEVAANAAVTGTVRFLGDAPAPAKLDITQDEETCGKTALYSEELVVSSAKGLANVVIFVDGVTDGKAAVPSTVTLDNTNCRYEPHVVAMVVGSTLKVGNDDPVLHNTHARTQQSDVFNIALPMQGQVIDKVIDKPGLMKVGCDAGHGWMTAWLAAFDHPYFAVTDADGKYSIPDLPPGEYTVVMWHEKLGRLTKPVTIAGSDVGIDLDYQ